MYVQVIPRLLTENDRSGREIVNPTLSRSHKALTLGDLPVHAVSISAQLPAQEVVNELAKYSELPGVMVMDGEIMVSVISRQKCFEQLGRPFGVEVYLRRPVSMMVNQIGVEALLMPAETQIEAAVRVALNRKMENIYEPIVVTAGNPLQYRLLDLHVLLLAQSKMLLSANQMIKQQVEIVRALSSSLNPSEVVSLILDKMGEIVKYDRAAVLLVGSSDLEFISGNGYPPGFDTAGMFKDLAHHNLLNEVIEQKVGVTYRDLTRREDWSIPQGLAPTRSWMGLPLLHSGRVIGILTISRTQVVMFNEDEISLSQNFADQAAYSLENARLFSEIGRLNHDLEGQISERTEALQSALGNMERLERMKSDFLAIASSELQTPIKLVKGYVEGLIDEVQMDASPIFQTYLEGIQNNLMRLQDVVGSMFEVAKFDQRSLMLNPQPVELNLLFSRLRTQIQEKVNERSIHFTIEMMDHLPSVQGDAGYLGKVFEQLLSNAIKFTPKGGRIIVRAVFLGAGQNPLGENAIRVTVTDSGVGIAAEKKELIFSRLYDEAYDQESSISEATQANRSGLGLAIVRGIVEAHSGLVWAESSGYDAKNLPGSRFHVLLPLHLN